MTRCKRCGLDIETATPICPSCGLRLDSSDDSWSERDYYAILNLSPNLSHHEISTQIKEAVRFWGQQANTALHIEQRHKAEMMLQYLAEAEIILLDPLKRKNYDTTRNNNKKKDSDPPSAHYSENKKSHQTSTATCARCGLRQKIFSSFCPACGFRFADSPANQKVVMPTFPKSGRKDDQEIFFPETQSYDASPNDSENSIQQGFGLFGWRKLTGTVIAVEPLYVVTVQNGWLSFLLKLSLWILFLPILLGVVTGVMIMRMTFSFLGFGKSGFFSSITSQMGGYFLIHKLLKPKEQIPVRDVRLRDTLEQEHLVRIRGELVAGNMSVGDEVEVEGFNRRGTLMFRRGRNKRTRSEIRVRRR